MKIIGLEEHFAVPEIVSAWQALDPRVQDMAIKASTEGDGGRRLLELGPERIAAMDDAGIDVQVLSLTTPGVQNLAADLAIDLATRSNDRLAGDRGAARSLSGIRYASNSCTSSCGEGAGACSS